MLNNWEDPFAKFANNTNDGANSTAEETTDNVINEHTLENTQSRLPQTVTEQVFTEADTSVSITPAPHAGDGIVSNEQLMTTAGAAPQVNPILEDAPQADSDLTGTGLEEIEMGASRIQVDDKKIINCRADLNQLVPFKYDWAWQKYLDGCANHWMPQEINMTADLALWRDPNGLTEDERTVSNATWAFFPAQIHWLPTIWYWPFTATSPTRNVASIYYASLLKKPCILTLTSTALNLLVWMRVRSSICTVSYLRLRVKQNGHYLLLSILLTLTSRPVHQKTIRSYCVN